LYQIKPDELMATITFINILVSLIIIVSERKNIMQFLFAKDKEKNCANFIACPCGCGYGTCQLDGIQIIDGRKEATCDKFSREESEKERES
ncbi:MAG: hypothetical protein ACTSP4_07375, partial [Candidatus Hodarchaeales archaeon]